MKKYALIFLCFFYSLATGFAAKPDVLFSTCSFNTPGGKPYIEVYLNTSGKSVTTVKKADGRFQGTIQVQLVIKKDGAAIYTDKYNLNSPLSEDVVLDSDFVDMQRIALDNGLYVLEIRVSDNNSAIAEPFIVQQQIAVDFLPNHLSLSDIELLESYRKPATNSRFVKNGIEMIPFPSNFYPPALSSIKFYAEVYHAAVAVGPDSTFLLRYRVEGYGTNKTVENTGGIKKDKASDVNVLLAELSLDKLQSGNYLLVVEVVNKANVVLATRKIFFQRSRQPFVSLAPEDLATMNTEGTFVERITVADSLKEYIRCIYPISSLSERSASADQVKTGDLKSMQRYFLIFWMNRNRLDPEGAWIEYKKMVNLVNANYQTWNRKGYETDRGRVYLEYGPPNEITTNYYEHGTYPHELWQYYTLKEQRNRLFVFLCKNFATNNFELIHSDAIGEINQFRWEDMLMDKQATHGSEWDSTK